MKKNTIVIVSHYADGVLNFRGSLIKSLIEIGLRVVVLAPDWTISTRKIIKSIGAEPVSYPLVRSGINPINDLKSVLYLIRWFKNEKPNIVLTYSAKTNVWGILASLVCCNVLRVAMVEGMGYIFTPGANGVRTWKQLLISFLLRILLRMAFICANKVVVLNKDDANDLHRLCSLPYNKIEVLGGIGVSLTDWSFQPPFTHPITFTLVARILREKGIFEFLKAAEIIKKRHPSTMFNLLGGLDDNPGAIPPADLQYWIDNGIVIWPGRVNVKPWLIKTSVFVLPSYREGLPRSTQEAMALGRPVITTDVPGCRDTVLNGVNGFLIPPRDVQALVEAMEKFIFNPWLINSMGRESREIAENCYDESRINSRLLGILKVS